MSRRTEVAQLWCGVIPAAVVPRGRRVGLGTAQQGETPCAGEGAGQPCVAELQKSGGSALVAAAG